MRKEFLLITILLGIGYFSVYPVHSEPIPWVTEIYPSVAMNPSGLVWDGSYFWTIDTKRDRIFKLNPRTLQLVSSYPVLGSNPANLVFEPNIFWVIEKETNILFQFDSSSLAFLSMVKLDYLQDEEIIDLAYHDGYYWILSKFTEGTHLSMTRDLSKPIVMAQVLPGTDPVGIEWTNDFLWFADNGTNNFYRYVLSDKLILVEEFQSPTREMSGFVYLDDEIWIMERETGNIVELTVKKTPVQKTLSSYFINKNGWVTNLVIYNTLKKSSRIDIFIYDRLGDPLKVFRDVEIPGNGVYVLPTKLYAPDTSLGTIKVVVLEGKVFGNTIKIDLLADMVFSDILR